MKRFISTFVLFCVVSFLSAQTIYNQNTAVEKIVPQSPQTASLFKYTEYPVSPATGIPEIQVPIYTIECDGIQVPISISYHASGIKVDDIATPVGLGWTLNAGGAIGRSVLGIQDTYAEYYLKSEDEVHDKLWNDKDGGFYYDMSDLISGNGRIDTQSDKYVYNFAGKTGSFRLNYENMQFTPIPYTPLKMEELSPKPTYIGHSNSGYKITDSDGTEYYFQEPETEYIRSSVGVGKYHTSSLYLTKIVTPSKRDTIIFEYEKTSNYQVLLLSEYQHVGKKLEPWGNRILDDYGQDLIKTTIDYTVPLLTSIKWQNNVATFNYLSNRLDRQEERLNSINIRNSIGDVVKNVDFCNNGYLGDSKKNYRMLLDSVKVYGTDLAQAEVYRFNYDLNPLPALKNVQDLETWYCTEDYWGYYNGTKSRTFIPKDYTVAKYKEQGTNREPDYRFIQNGILKEITYPTGGTSCFEYEQNKASELCGGIRVKSITHKDNNTTLNKEDFTYSNGQVSMSIDEDLFNYIDDYLYYYWGGSNLGHFTNSWSEYHKVCQTNPMLSLVGWNNFPVFYETVKRTYYDDKGKYTGCKESHYINDRDNTGCDYENGEYPRFYSGLYNCDEGPVSPLLVSEKTDIAGTKTSVTYAYKEVYMNKIRTGVRVSKEDVEVVICQGAKDYLPYADRDSYNMSYKYYNTYAFPSFRVLTNITKRNSEDKIYEKQTFVYDSQYRTLKPVEIWEECSDGHVLKKKYTYPFNLPSDITASNLYQNNYCDLVMKEETSKNDTLISTFVNEYNFDLNTKRLQLASVSSSIGESKLRKELDLRYDEYGNICETTSLDGQKTVYLWGYNNQLPIAVVNGTSYDDVKSAVGIGTLQSVAKANSISYMELLNLKGKIVNASPFVSLYNYVPLVGKKNEISPFGVKILYLYDRSNRLSEIRDSDGKTLQRYTYYNNNAKATLSHSYVKSETFLSEDKSKSVLNYRFVDGLGRDISVASTGNNGQMLQNFMEYDACNNPVKEWLPFTTDTPVLNLMQRDVESMVSQTYTDGKPYRDYEYTKDCVTINGEGQDWNEHPVQNKVRMNSAKEVKYYYANSKSLKQNGYYPADKLLVSESIDEDGKSLVVFTNFQGQKILERRNGNNDTYFVYNNLGQLRYVLSPEYQYANHKEQAEYDKNHGSKDNVNYKAKYAYEYRYDERGRVVKKILPGSEYIQYWYDKADRLTYMRDANLREKGLYRFMFYDRLGRLAVQGVCESCDYGFNGQNAMPKAEFGKTGVKYQIGGYGISGATMNKFAAEVVNYYDNYDYLATEMFKKSNWQQKMASASGACAVGLPTGSIVRTSNYKYLYGSVYYDAKGRVVRTFGTHLDGGMQEANMSYTFTNNPKVVSTTEYNANGDVEGSAEYTYAYNQYNDKLQSIDLRMNGEESAHRIAENTYDDLGRLLKVRRSGSAGDVDYAYNIRNWVTSISSKEFSETLHYTDGIGTPYYNGNISSIQWQNGASSPKSGYKFSYDGLNRLTSAIYGEGDDMSQNADRFSEKDITYNANGSIYRMKRYGMLNDGSYGLVDDLKIKLDGNALYGITDYAAETNYKGSANFADADGAGQEYWFNGNGSLSADANKGIARIDYDNYGCPRKIVFTNGNTTEYVYSSTGEKLRTTHKTAIDGITVALNGKDNLNDDDFLSEDKTDYHGSFIYENGKLDKVLYPGGYAIMAEKAAEANAKSRMMLFSMSSGRNGNLDKPVVPIDTDPDPVWPLDPITPGDPVLPLFPEPDDDTAPVGESIYEPINPFSPIRPIEPVQETAESSALYKVLSYNYYTQDHLGNNRAVIDEDGNVKQVTNYYPFGGVLSTTAYNSGDDLQPYKYNGKELDRTHGLDWYDYGARNYDAFLPMFTSLDPHCESYYNISPYAYCGNNPVNAIDPNGMDMFHTEDPATIRDILQTLGYTGELKTSDCEVHIDDEYFLSHYYKNGNKYSVGYNVFSYSENNPTEIDGNCKIISFYASNFSDAQSQMGWWEKTSKGINAGNGLFNSWLGGLVDIGISEGARSNCGMTYKQFYGLKPNAQTEIVRMATTDIGAYKFVKGAAKVGAFTTGIVSGLYAYDAYKNDRPDKNRRYIKAGMDVLVAAGCCMLLSSPVGWAVGTTYFLVDVCGGWDKMLGIKNE